MKRRRINLAAIASSDNYVRSKQLHVEYLRAFHEEHKDDEVLVRAKSIRKPFIKVFGVYKEVTIAEAAEHPTVVIFKTSVELIGCDVKYLK
jgi:hypothetical protein